MTGSIIQYQNAIFVVIIYCYCCYYHYYNRRILVGQNWKIMQQTTYPDGNRPLLNTITVSAWHRQPVKQLGLAYLSY